MNVIGFKGSTPLGRAGSEGHLNIVQRLLEAEADVNLRDDGEVDTALHQAAQNGHYKTVEALLKVSWTRRFSWHS